MAENTSMVKQPAPSEWGKDQLTAFFDDVESNAYVTFVRLPEMMRLAIDIDAFYRSIFGIADYSGSGFQYLFIPRAHSSYLAGVRLAAGTQVPESYMVTRGCLENVLYGFFLFKHPEHVECYLKRDETDDTKREFRKRFKFQDMIQVLKDENSSVGSAVSMLYERTIDWGAHPNEKALTSNMTMKREDGMIRLDGHHLSDNESAIKLALKTVMLSGVAGLKTVECMFPAKFKEMVLSEKLDSLLLSVERLR